jgi:head-tail adaptor
MPAGARRPYGRYAATDSGARDKRVTIEQRGESPGSSGFPVETWTSLVSLDASRIDSRGDERFSADQTVATFEDRWGVEYRPDLDPDLLDVPKQRRLVYLGRAYDILSAVVVGNKDGIELETRARQN